MTKKLFSLLLAALMLLALTGCQTESNDIEDTYPTLPSVQIEKTPLQQLEDAFAAASGDVCSIQYGTLRQTGDKTDEDIHSQTLSDAQSFDRSALYAAVADFPDNADFLRDFCDQRIQVIPSNTGIIRYQLTNLTWEEACPLLYDQPCESAYDQTLCGITIQLDGQGRFSRLEIVFTDERTVTTLFLSLTFSLNGV